MCKILDRICRQLCLFDGNFNMCDEIMELIEKIKIGDQFKALLIDCRFASADTFMSLLRQCS